MLLLLLHAVAWSGAAPAALPGPAVRQADTTVSQWRSLVLAAGDYRPAGAEAIRILRDGLRAPDSLVRVLAVRALGRLERSDLLADLAPVLQAGDPFLRAEAANAVGQAASRSDPGPARRVLESRLAEEQDVQVRAVLFRTLGRLPYERAEDAAAVERTLIQGSHGARGDADPAVLEGVAHGLASLYRGAAARRPPGAGAIERLVELTAHHHPTAVRRQAMDALVAGGRADSGLLLDALGDPDAQVRRLAGVAARIQDDLPGRERIVARALGDRNPAVRYEALRAYGRRLLATQGCASLLESLDDPSPHLRLLAIDLLADCGPGAAGRLRSLAARPADPDAWHVAAHALVALAAVAPRTADSLLPGFAAQPVPWSRMYAARAARVTGATPVLATLSRDPAPIVREAALAGLRGVQGHDADPELIRALGATDYSVLITAARALDSTPAPEPAIRALFAALDRVSRERRETSRDARVALLTTLDHLGGWDQANRLTPYLRDFDPVVAAKSRAVIARWTGTTETPPAAPRRSPSTPSWDVVELMDAYRPVLVMRGGGRIRLRLYPSESPTNTARFLRQVRSGWFNGLTFHRVVPNFVVQGGSPGANEYMGDGPFTRDELSLLGHRRGRVGISTRGRDTGDGQIFINLVDNPRLDHDYTVFAEVTEGMDVVDALLEGAVIERVELGEPRPARALDATERRLREWVAAHAAEAEALLAQAVNIPSGTGNPAGVRAVGRLFQARLDALGFTTRWAEGPSATPGRPGAGHLVAEHRARNATRGAKRLLLLGHLDTVFEGANQAWAREDSTGKGAGASDMKGGDVALLHALEALGAAGALDDLDLTVILTGDEEQPGSPLEAARAPLIEAARHADAALAFEGGNQGTATVARRGASWWTLTVRAAQGHSAGLFNPQAGSGAIYETARILNAFREELAGEEHLTFNPGVLAGGTAVAFDSTAGAWVVAGKTNIIAPLVRVEGDLRFLTAGQLERARARMRAIVARGLPGAEARITFEDGYPAMPPTAGNLALLDALSGVSVDLGYGPVEGLDPSRRGAGDISFVAPLLDSLDGLGVEGRGAHSPEERILLRSLPLAATRAALLIYRLGSGTAP